MKNNSMIIEDLPDELLLYIFCFLRPKDLLHGWYNLNYHINAIVRSVHIHITIKDNDDFNDSISYFKHFSPQITHLKDERFFPNIQVDLRSLTNIQFLYLTQCSKEQYQQIAPDNQPHLTHCFLLSVLCQFYERILFGQDVFLILYQLVFREVLSFIYWIQHILRIEQFVSFIYNQHHQKFFVNLLNIFLDYIINY
jgi:hypothetical protein